MKQLMSIALIALLFVFVIKPNASSGSGTLATDKASNAVNAFVPDPAKSQVNTSMTGKIKFAKDGSGNVNIKNWFAIHVNPTIDSTYYYNNDSTKTFPLAAGTDNTIFVMQSGVTSVTIQFGNGTASVQGM